MIGFSRLDAALRRLRPVATGAGLAAAAGFVLAAAPSAALAQQASTRNVILSDDPATPNHTVNTKKGFNLFALGDLGVSGMKMTGRFGWAVTSYGPCSDGFIVDECGDVQLNSGAFQFSVFEINLIAGTPPGDFNKVKAAYAGASAATGGGWNAEFDDALFGARFEIGPADGAAGRLFSGVTSTADNTCRDNTGPLNGYVSTGFSLLAQSDCPETWAGTFDGPRLLADTAYLPQFQANKTTFRFDFFRVPRDVRESSELLGNFSTYGTMSDYYEEMLKAYGNVTKAGAALGYPAPTIDGYPIGLDMRFDAFKFDYAPVRNVVYYQMTVVNNSAKIYGAGVDYDSLYMGLRPGWGRGQATSVYYVPSRNAILTTENGVNTGCNGARTAPGTIACANVGFRQGATGIVMLKSPIGDNRNKLLTTPSSQFYAPTNVNAGDTITFNHGHQCGFGNCWDQTWAVNDRRSFAMMSSTGQNYLEGRDPNALTNAQFYRPFRNVDFPARTPKFNTYIPGNWDYNHDGKPDTLFYDTCHLQGCVRTWADTMPGTTRYTVRGSNVGGTMAAGPFKLKAGDTTSFVFAFVGAPDSSSFEAAIDAATDVYQSFYLVPKPAPAPTVAVIAPTAADSGRPVARFTFTTEAVTYTDLFLQNFANNLATSPRSDLRILRTLNPTLAADISARATSGGNLAEIQIFKSCDNGRTFTATADCRPAPLLDQKGQPIGTGWRPYAIITPENGKINNVFEDANVIGGRTFLYSIVTKTKGFSAVVKDSVGGKEVVRTLNVVDTTYSALARNGPTVAKVYVPLSYAAGAVRANAVVTNVNTKATLPITAITSNAVTAGTYRLAFGNRFTITDVFDRSTQARTVTVKVDNRVDTAVVNGVKTPNYVRSTQTFTGSKPVDVSGTVATTTTTTTGTVTTTTRVLNGTGFVLLDAASAPLFVSTNLTAGNVTPQSFFSRADFPGFALDFTNANPQGTNPDFERIITAENDTVVLAIQNGQGTALQYVEGRSRANNGVSGEYNFLFQSDGFGPGAPFTLAGTAATESAVIQSLEARPRATTSDTSAAVVAAVRKQFSAFATREFVAIPLPFTATNKTFGREASIVVPRRGASGNTLRLGAPTSPDTLNVTIPDTLWLPGDTIFLVENVERDSTVGGNLVVSAGAVVRTSTPIVTLGPVVLDCNSSFSPTLRHACNPLALNTPAATGYYSYSPGTRLVVRYPTLFAAGDSVTVQVNGAVQRPNVVTAADLKKIRVVPNPFIVQSLFDQVNNSGNGDPRIIFTGVPAQGNLRIYSVSGQYLAERNWTPADLNGTGDYQYDLRTREGLNLASGLYIYVIRGTGLSGKTEIARGKFVLIR